MRAYVTYCSAEKRRDAGDLPAIERYVSARIRAVAGRAARDGAAFFVLSGRLGLVAADDPVPWYDHRLADDEVDAMADRVAAALRDRRIHEGVFFAPDPARRPDLRPHL